MKKLIGIVILAMIGFALYNVPNAEALSCAPPQPAKQEIEQSSVVFKGRAIDIKSGGLTIFQVEVAWKGIDDQIVEIYDNGWDPYTKGTEYLVFGSQRDGKLKTNLCGRTGPWDTAREEAMKGTNLDPIVLKNEVPQIVGDSSERFNRQIWPVIMAIFTLSLILLISIVMVSKKRKK